jgi:thiazole biosynthesis enzyme
MSAEVSPRIDETQITSLIVGRFAQDFLAGVSLDVAIAGAGPAGITAARLLAQRGWKVAVFERNLHVGGGMWGGGMLFPRLVIQEEAKSLVEGVGVALEPAGNGYYLADSVETVTKCTAAAIDAGARIWVGIAVEDVMIDDQDRVRGVVVNWGAVEEAHLHVDPLALSARIAIDSTGHESEVARTIQRKIPGATFDTPTGKVMIERPMNSAKGEGEIVALTKEIYPGLIVAGMAANAVASAPRMGAIFGGMFLSGERAAKLADARLRAAAD